MQREGVIVRIISEPLCFSDKSVIKQPEQSFGYTRKAAWLTQRLAIA